MHAQCLYNESVLLLSLELFLQVTPAIALHSSVAVVSLHSVIFISVPLHVTVPKKTGTFASFPNPSIALASVYNMVSETDALSYTSTYLQDCKTAVHKQL